MAGVAMNGADDRLTLDAFLGNLRKIRIIRELSQAAVAAGLGVVTIFYAKLEAGEFAMSVEDVLNLAAFFGMSPACLFDVDAVRVIG